MGILSLEAQPLQESHAAGKLKRDNIILYASADAVERMNSCGDLTKEARFTVMIMRLWGTRWGREDTGIRG